MRLHRDTLNRTLTILFVVTILFLVPARAQVTTGDITGRIADSEQRVVAGATVTATNKGTGQSRTATTNEAGDFTITDLPPGKYDITVEASSFSKSLVRDYELNVGANRTLNIEMKPGEVSAVVEIMADSLAIETTKSDIGGVVTPLEVQNLPL